MLQQIKPSIDFQGTENPQISSEKIKLSDKKKKQFKIKKFKYGKNKQKNDEIFSDPIYAGLDTQDMEDENRNNLGPWVRDALLPDATKQSTGRLQSLRQTNQQTHKRTVSINSDGIQNLIINQTQSNIRHLPHLLSQSQKKPKRQLHEIRYSSLTLQVCKMPSLSSIKPEKTDKHKSVQMNRSKSQTSSIDLLKYNSIKYLLAGQKYYENLFSKKLNNVVNYNYCCSNSENNLLGSELKQSGNIKNLFPLSEKLTQKLTKSPSIFDRNYTDKHLIKSQKDSKTLAPMKKSINRQLYEELIKRKNKIN